jgi:hypothetical protein
LVNIRKELMFYAEDVEEGLFILEKEDVLLADTARILR